MFDFFNKVLGILQTVFQLITNIIDSLILGLSTLSTACRLPVQLVVYMPDIFGSCILIVVALAIVKFIIGR